MFGLLPLGFFNANTVKGDAAQNLMENFFSSGFTTAFNLKDTFRTGVKETDEEYIICAELPGVNKSDIKVSYKNNYFTISVIRRVGTEQSGNNFRVIQNCCGQTSKSFYMENININFMKVAFKGDMLIIRLPKNGKIIESTEKVLIK